jgi:hypothetical protein
MDHWLSSTEPCFGRTVVHAWVSGWVTWNIPAVVKANRVFTHNSNVVKKCVPYFWLAVVSKGMEHGAKVALVSRLGLVGVCRQLQAVISSGGGGGGGDDDDDEMEETETRAAQLTASVGQELFACLRQAATAAAADPAEPHAPAPPAGLYTFCIQLARSA